MKYDQIDKYMHLKRKQKWIISEWESWLRERANESVKNEMIENSENDASSSTNKNEDEDKDWSWIVKEEVDSLSHSLSWAVDG